jgi:hypothetical protein
MATVFKNNISVFHNEFCQVEEERLPTITPPNYVGAFKLGCHVYCERSDYS